MKTLKTRKKKNTGWMRQSLRHDYLTPPDLVDVLLKKHIGRDRFDIDVCCSVPNIPAIYRFTSGKSDALKRDWNIPVGFYRGDNKICWMNPPAGTALQDFCSKMLREVDKGAEVYALLPSRFPDFYATEFKRKKDAGLQGILRRASFIYVFPEWTIGFGLPENYGKPDCFPTNKKDFAKTSWWLCHFGQNPREAELAFRFNDPFKDTKYEGVLLCPAR